jgi:hypothetical protein
MKRIVTVLFLLSVPSPAANDDSWSVVSPDGRLKVQVAAAPSLTVSVTHDNQPVIAPSPLGVELKRGGALPGTLKPVATRHAQIEENYPMVTGKRSECHNRANELAIDFGAEKAATLSLIVRAYNDGVAYRYHIAGTGEDTVLGEASGFRLPAAAKAWFASYFYCYESNYSGRPNWTGFAGDIQVPALFQTPANQWVLLTEAAVDGTYAGARLHVAEPATGLLHYRLEGQPTAVLPWRSPWRVAMIGDSLKPLVESTLVNDLSPASKIADTAWIQPGAASFPWLTGPDTNNTSLARMSRFVDLAAEMGWTWIEFDNALALGNQTADPPEKWMACEWIPELVAYAKRKGVAVYGWDHWKNLDTPAKRDHILGWLAAKGFKGIKVDFLDSDSQTLYRFRDDIARACADRKLMLSYHGDVTPRGLQRTWPNIASHEGVKGEEYYLFSDKPAGPAANVNLVFTRNIPGSMDYTPGAFDLPGAKQSPRLTSNAHEMALAVVFESGWQGLGLNPESAKGPAIQALGFLKNLPAAWDDIRFLDGMPDEFAVLARRKGDDWWIAGINAATPRSVTLKLDFLKPGSQPAILYQDDAATAAAKPLETRVTVTPVTLDPARPLTISLPANGGFGIKFAANVPMSAGGNALRRTVSLDGVWQIAEGKLDPAPTVFERSVPVPGLVDMAKPAFDDPGPKVGNRELLPSKDKRRDAFWYRRSFNIDGPVPAVAMLKIGKAMFGSRVILNGKLLGEHAPSFTPGYFECKDALKTGDNEVLIRVCADRDTVTRAIPSGFDFEKERYMPGIFDSVELVLSGTPHIVNVQTVPDIANKTVRVQTQVRNTGPDTAASLSFVVRETKSGKVVGMTTSAAEPIAAGAEKVLDVRIPIESCRLWSPEDPFLYTLEVKSPGDAHQTRFGMREFKFDPVTRKAMLNGKPYFMRGTNITLYRFFEDPNRGNLPWDEQWVRQLHRQIKDMNWNCLRHCIGFPPEMWYRIADELGILIQDEYPIWFGGPGWSVWPKELKREQLALEFTEWMRERWNHPCVVIWDASNETISSETSPAVRQVRALDLSNRPWDNSYSAPLEPGDTFESHPYHFMNSGFKLRNLAGESPVPQGSALKNDEKHPVIINEYGWLWLNRDSTPTTLTKDLYKNLLGPNSTPAQRLELYARYLAAETEFWRVHRKVAAVMHFTALGYSRPDGQTSDHWLDVEKLTWEPNFQHYVRDAFAPVGLCVNFWKDSLNIGEKVKVPVILINDLDQPWTGPVTLRVMNENQANEKRVVSQAKQDCRIEAFGRTELNFDITLPADPGRYSIEAELRGANDQAVHSVRVIECIDPAIALRALGLAHQKPATASSSVTARNRRHSPNLAVDGNPATYWSSDSVDPSWLAVDLGAMKKISRVCINWETAHAKAFTIQVSPDGQTWTEVYKNDAGQGGINDIRIDPASTRWVRMLGSKRATEWGYAIRELQVFE